MVKYGDGMIKNIVDLRMETLDMIQRVRDKERTIEDGIAWCAGANAVIKTCGVELKYAEMTKTKPNIPFLYGNGKTIDAKRKPKQLKEKNER